MMQNWSSGNAQNICGTAGGTAGRTSGNWNLFGGGIMMFVVFALIVVAIYFIWKNGNGQHFPRPKSNLTSLSNLTDTELEAELNKRKSTERLEAELADLKRQIAELKDK